MRINIGGRGQGSILKTPASENWQACFYVNGRERRVSTGTSDQKAATKFLRAKLDEVGAARRGLIELTPAAAQKVTVAELLDEWVADIQLRLKSWKSSEYHSRAARQKFGQQRAVQITAEAVDRWVAEMRAAKAAPATCNRRTQMLASAFKLAVGRKRVLAAPVFRKLSEQGNARQGFFEQDEVERVIAELPAHLLDLTRFCYLASWRKGEALGLKWDSVDLKTGEIRLATSKNGKPRVLALGGQLAEILARRDADRLTERQGEPVVSDFVFHLHGQRIKDFKRAWRSAVKAAGLPPKMFHDLRRSGIRNMIRAGVPETVAMSISGHRTRATFDRYNITSTADQRKAMEAVSA